MQKDWRLTNQMNYLYRATLKKADFKRGAINEHEHCEFCWDKFGENEADGFLTRTKIFELRYVCK